MFDSETEALIRDLPVFYAIFLFSTVCHEAAHAWVGKKLGDDTAMSWLTLDPRPHIKRTPFGLVILPLISYFVIYKGAWMLGFASVPYNPYWARSYPKKSAWMSLAGPAANFVLALFFYGILFVYMRMLQSGIIEMTDFTDSLKHILFIPFMLNFLYMAFNLMPLPPLDGSEVPILFLPDGQARKYQAFINNPNFLLPGLLIACFCFDRVFMVVWLPLYRFLQSFL